MKISKIVDLMTHALTIRSTLKLKFVLWVKIKRFNVNWILLTSFEIIWIEDKTVDVGKGFINWKPELLLHFTFYDTLLIIETLTQFREKLCPE